MYLNSSQNGFLEKILTIISEVNLFDCKYLVLISSSSILVFKSIGLLVKIVPRDSGETP
jgi:hypothetical protein